jgi:hypothetical protein
VAAAAPGSEAEKAARREGSTKLRARRSERSSDTVHCHQPAGTSRVSPSSNTATCAVAALLNPLACKPLAQ